MANSKAQPQSRNLGMDRWVQFAYVGVFLLSFWFLDHLFVDVAAFVAEKMNTADPDPNYLTLGAATAAGLIALVLYRNPGVNRFSRDVAYELEHVTWPTKDETWSNTVVVVIVSIIAAVILGVFDAVWSAVTDLIYK
ncbi:MAG: preprotein translocase subunit SecE [Myxococcota bacterium]